MIKQLRSPYSDEQLKDIYPVPHNHTIYTDHIVRVDKTIELAMDIAPPRLFSVADLSCGDGAVAKAMGADCTILGDFAPGYPICGDIKQTIRLLGLVDLYICTETLEHVAEPKLLLEMIRHRAFRMVLSTPVDKFDDDNPEHYWAWDAPEIASMLYDTGWEVLKYTEICPPPGVYNFGIWGCVAK